MKDVISHIPNVQVQVSWFTALILLHYLELLHLIPCLVMLEPLRSNTGAQLLTDPKTLSFYCLSTYLIHL